MSKILLVEDESDLAIQIRNWLQREHHLVEIVNNGPDALTCLRLSEYDILLLDWLLPGVSGIEVCRQYRARGGKSPVLMMTARSAIEDKEMGFDAGADDYLAKPFHLRELSLRIKALIRRAAGTTTGALILDELVLDPVSRQVTKSGAYIHLEPKEFNLLEFLMRNANKVFSAEALVSRVWESDSKASPDAIRTYIRLLRKKIDSPDKKSLITTIHGVGYKLEAP